MRGFINQEYLTLDKRRPLIAGNWKLNGTRKTAVELAGAVRDGAGQGALAAVDIVICPPAVHLADVASVVGGSPVMLGGQNCSEHTDGAFTGEVSASMLVEYGCNNVILGHSERRALFGESSSTVAKKCAASQLAGLTPILCVGETLVERKQDQVDTVISEQLDALLSLGGAAAFSHIIVAYEPVWAIGTGETATPEQAQAVHTLIREKIAVHDEKIAASLRILYGGSVKPDNAGSLFEQPDIDGGLIGGAALDAESFLAICRAAVQ